MWRLSRLAQAVFLAFGVAQVLADEKLKLIPEDVSLWDESLAWDKAVTVRNGVGYRDNVLLSPFHPHGSPFVLNGLDAILMRQPLAGGCQLVFFLSGDDQRYWRPVGVDAEQTLMFMSQIKQDFAQRWQAGLSLLYFYQDQVQDVSLSEADLFTARVRGHTVSLRPSVRRFLGRQWSAQLELSANRQFFQAPLDGYWEFGPRVVISRDYGYQSEVHLSYGVVDRLYDTRLRTDAEGFTLPGGLKFWQHKVELADKHYWDAARRWRTTSALTFNNNIDNGEGFFDYQEYQISEQISCQAKKWALQTKAALAYFDFPVRASQQASPATLHRTVLTVDLRAEKSLFKWLKVFAEYEYERTLSNAAEERYQVNTVSGGVNWEF